MKKTFKRLLKATTIAMPIVMVLPGCSVLNTGEEEFSCSGMPGSIYCASARDVYEATNDGVVPSPMRKDDAYNDECNDCVRSEEVNPDLKETQEADIRKAEKKTLAVMNDEVINNYVTPALPDKPIPIRTPSQVMRIWVASYVDVNGDLQAPGFVYTEIEPRRWVIKTQSDEGSITAFSPLEDKGDYFTGKEPDPSFNSLEKYKEKTNASR